MKRILLSLLIPLSAFLAPQVFADVTPPTPSQYQHQQTGDILPAYGTVLVNPGDMIVGNSDTPPRPITVPKGSLGQVLGQGALSIPVWNGGTIPAAIVTPATAFPTPAGVGTPANGDLLVNQFTILAAGAPTAAFIELPKATASAGKPFVVSNQGSNPLAVVPLSGDNINVNAAATPYSCPTLKTCTFTPITTVEWTGSNG